jgi:hypothetical protein
MDSGLRRKAYLSLGDVTDEAIAVFSEGDD